MVKRNLFAFAPGVLRGGCFRFAAAVGGAAVFHSRKHKVLFAGDAAAPDRRGEKQQ